MPLRPSSDSYVILGSDGLWDVMADEDAVHIANRAIKLHRCDRRRRGGGDGEEAGGDDGVHPGDDEAQVAAQGLVDEALRRGTADNITVVVMGFSYGGVGSGGGVGGLGGGGDSGGGGGPRRGV